MPPASEHVAAEIEEQVVAQFAPEPVMEPKAVQEPELKSHRVDMDALYSKAFMQSKTGDHYVALKL